MSVSSLFLLRIYGEGETMKIEDGLANCSRLNCITVWYGVSVGRIGLLSFSMGLKVRNL